MSTCEEIDDLLNILNLISNIKEDLKKLKSLGIPTDESGITDLKDTVDATLNKNVELKILLQEAYGNQLSLRKLSLIDDQNQEGVTDISIRFFGIEWPVVLKRWNNVERKTRATYSTEKAVKVDLISMAEIIKLINLTSAELEGHRAAVTSGQLTEDQKKCQQRVRQPGQARSQEIVKTESEHGEENTLRGRMRRKSIIFNNAFGKQLKSSLKRTPTQMMRTKSPTFNFSRRRSSMHDDLSLSTFGLRLK